MNGYEDGWIDRWLGGLMNGWEGGWMGRWVNGSSINGLWMCCLRVRGWMDE